MHAIRTGNQLNGPRTKAFSAAVTFAEAVRLRFGCQSGRPGHG